MTGAKAGSTRVELGFFRFETGIGYPADHMSIADCR